MLTIKPLEPNPKMPSYPVAFEFAMFFNCIVTSSLVVSTLSWMLTFSSSYSNSFNHSASFLYGTGLSHNILQNFRFFCIGWNLSRCYFSTELLIQCFLVASEKFVISILVVSGAIASQLLRFCRNSLFQLLNNDFKTFCLHSVFIS